ncbi:MAG TPA: hypothetical protein VHZ73_06430 [Vicinamibacterales bacterium]|jgi:hypothetical protein|nr:hypothetical protein [Vicinamibacterales bacterium]
MKVSRPWLAVVLALFSLPLFVGLGRKDIRGDEAGHTFSVERILEIGDWMAPKSSPSENAVFLEKPPLKFWLVAAPIKLGLLPHDEFGFRFWDALFGGLAFLYVFAIGTRLAGPLCGAVGVLICFVHGPLLFEHGLRGNNMEAALLLCYCGGLYHYMLAMATEDRRRKAQHASVVALYFVLGFMVKDVAALFMPATAFVTSMVFGDWRRKLIRDWAIWGMASALALALIAPWFLYTWHRFGNELWSIMFGAHVYTRLTSFLDPTHLHPWYFYFTSMYLELSNSDSFYIVAIGLVALLVETIRRRWVEGGLVLLWFAFPLVMISIGTSKLYHYAYPYVPPAALGGGFLVGWIYMLVPKPIEQGMRLAGGYVAQWIPRVKRACEHGAVRTTILGLAVLAIGIAALSLVHGPVRIDIGKVELFKSSGVVRPCVLVILAGILTGAVPSMSRATVLLVVASLLPITPYRDTLAALNVGEHPMHTARDCVQQVNAQPSAATYAARGLYVDGLMDGFGHEHYLYFRKIRPWTIAPKAAPESLSKYLYDPAEMRPSLVLDSVYQTFLREPDSLVKNGGALPPMVSFGDVVLLLPGPYAVCSSEARAN